MAAEGQGVERVVPEGPLPSCLGQKGRGGEGHDPALPLGNAA